MPPLRAALIFLSTDYGAFTLNVAEDHLKYSKLKKSQPII